MNKESLSLGAQYKRDREEKAARAAENLKYLMSENVEAQVCCEGWDEAIRLMRGLLLEFNLKPRRIPIEQIPMKDMVELLRRALKEKGK